jgi:hypothetical protein
VRGRDRWFLYLHLMDVHEYTYDQETALFGGTIADVYDNAIRWVNSVLAVLFDELAAQGYAENTIVVIAADHGEAFLERGFEGHARNVFPEVTTVPFVISFPFQARSGVVVDARTRNVDIWPTLFDLLGLPAPADTDGRSLVPGAARRGARRAGPKPDPTGIAPHRPELGPAQPEARAERGRARRNAALRARDRPKAGRAAVRHRRDPLEVQDRARERPRRRRAAARDRRRLPRTPPRWGAAPRRELEELELNQLRALGYAVPDSEVEHDVRRRRCAGRR